MITTSADPSRTADVLVVGAGPAGSSAAWHLATAGLDVAVLEKARFPREKVCGDGLTPRGVKALAAADDAQPLVVEPAGLLADVDAHLDQGAGAARGEAVAADLLAGERRLLEKQDVEAGESQPVGGTAPGRSGADDDDVGIVARGVGDARLRANGGVRRRHAARSRLPGPQLVKAFTSWEFRV